MGAATLMDLHRLDFGSLAWSDLNTQESPRAFGGAPRSLFGFAAADDRLRVFGGTLSSVAYPGLLRHDLSLNDLHQVRGWCVSLAAMLLLGEISLSESLIIPHKLKCLRNPFCKGFPIHFPSASPTSAYS